MRDSRTKSTQFFSIFFRSGNNFWSHIFYVFSWVELVSWWAGELVCVFLCFLISYSIKIISDLIFYVFSWVELVSVRYLASGRFITAGTIPCLFCQHCTATLPCTICSLWSKKCVQVESITCSPKIHDLLSLFFLC